MALNTIATERSGDVATMAPTIDLAGISPAGVAGMGNSALSYALENALARPTSRSDAAFSSALSPEAAFSSALSPEA